MGYLAALPPPDRLADLGTRYGDDELAVGPRVLYLSYAAGSLDSPLQRVLKGFPAVVTTRNWSTATRPVELTR